MIGIKGVPSHEKTPRASQPQTLTVANSLSYVPPSPTQSTKDTVTTVKVNNTLRKNCTLCALYVRLSNATISAHMACINDGILLFNAILAFVVR